MPKREPKPNLVLRQLRLAYGFTQAQLAEHLRSELLLIDDTDTAAPDARLVSAWESGEISRPQQHYRQALRSVFGVRDDSALGFAQHPKDLRRSPRVLVCSLDFGSEDEMNRQEFLRGIAAVAFSAAAGAPLQPWLGIGQSRSVRPSLIGMDDVASIEQATETFSRWDMTRGGVLSADAVMAQLNWATTLLDQGTFATQDVRRRMCNAVAHLARIAGMSAYDAGLHQDARRALALGVHAAAEGTDWPLRAFILAGLARQSITLGHPDNALQFMALAHYGARETATPAAAAMLHVVSARALAASGNRAECLRAVGMAEDAYAAPTGDDPAWIRYYVPAQLSGDTGVAVFDAAQHDDSGEALRETALQRLSAAAGAYGPEYPRSTAFCEARIAAIHFDEGDADVGVQHGQVFHGMAQTISSARITEDVGMLYRHTAAHLNNPGVAHLREALKEMEGIKGRDD